MDPRPLPESDRSEDVPRLAVVANADEFDAPEVDEREEPGSPDGTPLHDPLKLYVRQIGDGPLLTAEQERELIELRESCFRSEDMREGVRAFGEKRPPRWQGR